MEDLVIGQKYNEILSLQDTKNKMSKDINLQILSKSTEGSKITNN